MGTRRIDVINETSTSDDATRTCPHRTETARPRPALSPLAKSVTSSRQRARNPRKRTGPKSRATSSSTDPDELIRKTQPVIGSKADRPNLQVPTAPDTARLTAPTPAAPTRKDSPSSANLEQLHHLHKQTSSN